jgi:molybdopterin synthase sulfur carrier subunit
MDLEVSFFGPLREISGTQKEKVTIEDGVDLSMLVKRLGEIHSTQLSKEIRNIKSIRILINGREYKNLNEMETELKDGDVVVFLPPIFGG